MFRGRRGLGWDRAWGHLLDALWGSVGGFIVAQEYMGDSEPLVVLGDSC